MLQAFARRIGLQIALLGAPGLTTRSNDATRSKEHRYSLLGAPGHFGATKEFGLEDSDLNNSISLVLTCIAA